MPFGVLQVFLQTPVDVLEVLDLGCQTVDLRLPLGQKLSQVGDGVLQVLHLGGESLGGGKSLK